MAKRWDVGELLFDVARFQSLLKTRHVGRCFVYRSEVESTMVLASRELNEGAPHGTLIFAEAQTGGRGRSGRSWVTSGHGKNLLFTLLARPLKIDELLKLNMSAAIAVTQTARSFGVKEAVVKWPNDVWVHGKKLCGILVDTSIMGSSVMASIGIGININEDMSTHPAEEVRTAAASISNELRGPADREHFLAEFCNHFEATINLDHSEVLQRYQQLDFLVGKEILVKPKGREAPEGYRAIALEILPSGLLRVKPLDEPNTTRDLSHEDVMIRPTPP